MKESTFSLIRLPGLLLEIRRSVALRERAGRRGVLYYLSLLEDEIDERFDTFLASWSHETSAAELVTSPDLAAAGPRLELTDAVVWYGSAGEIVVVRGGACTVPFFWSCAGTNVHLSTALPSRDGARFSRNGLASALAAVCFSGSYEPNAWTETALQGWRRVRRGTATFFREGAAAEERPIVFRSPMADGIPDEDRIAERIRTSFELYRRSQRHVASSVLEVSGGYDSTLAGAAALHPGNTMRGVSVEFPYYEFRFEAPVQRAVSGALGISRSVLNGERILPYAPWERAPLFDEPAVFVTGIGHAEKVARFAATHKATRIYMGHGGDQLFSTDLTANEGVAHLPSRAPFSRSLWRHMRRVLALVQQPLWRRRSNGCFVYDARQDVWVKETFGATIRTPFSDTALFRTAQMWSQLSASQNARPDKTILRRALGDLLPAAVVERKGKVAYDGVWMRAYAVHGDHIARMFDRTSSILEYIGISPAWLIRRTRQLAEWQPVSDREVLGAYAIAAWLTIREIERPSRVAWE